MHLLVIEDYPPLQQSLTKGLREAGFAVDSTRDGREGLWYAMGNEYDLIILDLMLPGMDGLEILNKIQNHNTIAVCLKQLAPVYSRIGLETLGTKLWGCASRILGDIEESVTLGERPGPTADAEIKRVEGELRARLDDQAYLEAYEEGKLMSIDEAISLALAAGGRVEAPD